PTTYPLTPALSLVFVVPAPGVDGAAVLDQLFGLEEQAQLALGALGAVAAVHQVQAAADAEVAADGARDRVGAEGLAHQLAAVLDGLGARDRQRNQRGAGHELHQAGVEALADVVFVVLGSELLGHLHQLHADDLHAGALEAADDVAHQAALYAIGLDQDQGAFKGHVYLRVENRGGSLPLEGGRREASGAV